MTSLRRPAASPHSVAGPPLRLAFSSLLRADFLVFLKHRRALIISMVLPVFVLASVARWTPVGGVMTLFARVLNLHAWYSRDTLSVVACLAYIAVFGGIGIRWFQWDAR